MPSPQGRLVQMGVAVAKAAVKSAARRRLAKAMPTRAAAAPRAPRRASRMSRDQVVIQYTPYVRSIAGKVKKSIAPEIEFEDLVEYGMIGLLEAAERFDPKHGVNFMTFAYYRIRGAIYDGLRGMGWMSRTEYAKVKYEERANDYMATVEEDHASKPPASANEAAQRLTNVVHGLAAIFVSSLDAAEGLQIKDEELVGQDERLALEEARALVRATIAKLNEEERQLLRLYYYEDHSLQEIGEKLGLSKSWTSRLHARVVDKLQRLLHHLNN